MFRQTAGPRPSLRDGFEEEPHGDRAEADVPAGQGRGDHLPGRTSDKGSTTNIKCLIYISAKRGRGYILQGRIAEAHIM